MRLDQDTINLVKEHDANRYAATFFAGSEARDALLALYAFNLELERIPDIVSEPTLGEIRLQWWRDVLEKAQDGGQSGNPLADELGRMIRKTGFPTVRLVEMVDARSFDFSDDLLPDLTDLRIFLKKTSVSLFKLSAFVLDSKENDHVMRAAQEAGLAYGFTSMLLHLPLHVSKGRLYLPQSILDSHQVDQDALRKGQSTGQLRDAVNEIIESARQHYASFKILEKEVPSKFSPAFLPVTLVEPTLAMIGKENHKLLREFVRINPMYRLWKYWRAAAFGIF